eukprot:XP_019075277.1 PREDICTED: uncharacterized protein LOC100267868 isoform X5 [Vitis vinifera]
MASPQIGSPDCPKPIVIKPPPKLRVIKPRQKFVSQLLVWGLIPTSLRNYMSFFLISKPLVSLLPLYPLVLWQKKDLSSGKTIGSAKEREGLYYFNEIDVLGRCSPTVCNSTSYPKDSELLLSHKKMGHPSFQYLKHLFPSLCSNKTLLDFQCEVCELAKHHRASFPKSKYKPSIPFTLIHSDLWGPSRTPNRTHKKWFITFIDDHTRLCWVYLLTDKTEVRSVFLNFHSMIQTQFQTKIQILRTDNGTEYFNHSLSTYLEENGIIHQSSCVNTPQQNGVAERKNRHILEVARALLFTSHMPSQFWGDSKSFFLIRDLVHIFHFVSLGPLCLSTPLGPKRNKFDPRALKCVFLGYSSTQKGYKCYDPVSKKLYVSLDVTFFEHTPYYSLQGESMSETRPYLTSDYLDVAMFESILCLISTPSPNTKGHLNSGGDTELQKNRETLVYSRRPKSKFNETLISEAPKESELVIVPTPQEYGSNFDQVTDDLPIALRKQSRSCTLHPISKFVSYNFLFAKCHAFTTNLDKIQIPKNIQEAFKIPEWKEVVMEEIRALEKNENWEVMNLPRGKKLVGCKWIFTVKYKTDGTIERYKACLVAKGFTRTYDIDYTETFAPVAKLNTIRVLLSLAANLDWPLRQFDIKNAFLNGELEEEVFMMLPPGFCKEEEETRVCKLKKSLYGLKQLPRAWFDRFAKVIKNQGYQQGQSDHTMFFKQSNDGRITI